MSQPWVYTCHPCPKPASHLLHHSIPLGCLSAPALSALFHAPNLDWSSISHMVIYTFQHYSLKSSDPRLLPQSPKICSLYLFCCPFCALADEWIKLWYIYTMEYYSAIKKAFESVLMRWMKLEPIIQSEVSQKNTNTVY